MPVIGRGFVVGSRGTAAAALVTSAISASMSWSDGTIIGGLSGLFAVCEPEGGVTSASAAVATGFAAKLVVGAGVALPAYC